MMWRVLVLGVVPVALTACSADAIRETVPFATMVLGPSQGYVAGGSAAAKEAEDEEDRGKTSSAPRPAGAPMPTSQTTARPHETPPVQSIRRTVVLGGSAL